MTEKFLSPGTTKNMSVTAQNIMNKSFKFVENKNRDQVKKIFSEQLHFIPVVNKNGTS